MHLQTVENNPISLLPHCRRENVTLSARRVFTAPPICYATAMITRIRFRREALKDRHA
jgi:hypothetical protein